MLKSLFFVCLFFIFSTSDFKAQSKKADSLISIIDKAKIDTIKIGVSNLLCEEYIKLHLFDTVIIISNVNIQKSSTLKYYRGEAFAYFNLAMAYFSQDYQTEATDYFFKAVDKYIPLNDKAFLAKCYGNIGTSYYKQSLYPKALEYQTKSLNLNTEINNKMGVAKCYFAIANVYIELLKYNKAIDYAEKSIKIREILDDKKGIASCYLSIGIVYAYQYKYDQALKYINKSLDINKSIHNDKGIAYNLENIGIIYKEKKMYNEAIDYYIKSLAIFREGKYYHSVASSLIHIGNLYNELKQYDKAKKYLLEAESISIEINTLDFQGLINQSLSQTSYATKKYKDAYEYHVKYKNIMDTIFNKENSQQLSDIKTKYEVEKKENELKLVSKIEKEKLLIKSEEDKKRQNVIIFGVLLVLILVSIFSVFIYRGLQQNKKAYKIISIQKNEVEHQKHMVDEKQKEILDSITYAKRLQNAILPQISYLKSYFQNSFVLYKPKDIVAGDFYWMHVVENNNEEKIYIAAADSTGHGVPGAMVSLVCSIALDKAINDFGLTKTGEILDKTTDLVLETFAKSGEEIKDGMDISLLCIDKKDEKITWSGANNQLWYINKHSEFIEIKADKQPVGKSDYRKLFTTHNINFEKGSIFYLMTDGFPDQFGGPKGKKYKYKQLQDLLISNANLSLDGQQNILEDSFAQWKGDLEQVDDVTIIGIKI